MGRWNGGNPGSIFGETYRFAFTSERIRFRIGCAIRSFFWLDIPEVTLDVRLQDIANVDDCDCKDIQRPFSATEVLCTFLESVKFLNYLVLARIDSDFHLVELQDFFK